MSKVQVLFVDDEERLLSGLRRMLRDQRAAWDLYFVNSGRAALELMRNQRIDVIVSDMRMPEMDGAELLDIVQKEYPDTTRIILSGYAENETVLRTVGPSHRYLAKPCEPEILKMTIAQALALRKTLNSEDLKRLVSGLKNIPTPSAAYQKFMGEVSSPRATVDSVAGALSADVALTAQTLRLTNSAYFALPQKVSSLEQAVRLLGFDTIRSLVTLAVFFSAYEGDTRHLDILENLNRRSIDIARLARRICLEEGTSEQSAGLAFCAGLVAHVGTLILVANRPDRFDEAIEMVESGGMSIVDAERAVFNATHAELGAYLLGLWGFQEAIVEAVAQHHMPVGSPRTGMTPALALHIAQYITRAANGALHDSEHFVQSDLNEEALQAMGVVGRLADWLRLYREISYD